MSTMIDSLKKQNAMLQGEVERFATAVDNLSAQLSEAYSILREHEPAFVAAKLGEEMQAVGETVAPVGNRKQRRVAKKVGGAPVSPQGMIPAEG